MYLKSHILLKIVFFLGMIQPVLYAQSFVPQSPKIQGWGHYVFIDTNQAAMYLKPLAEFYETSVGQQVLCVGASNGNSELCIGFYMDSVSICMEDIRDKFLYLPEIDLRKEWYEKLYQRKFPSSYYVHIGTEKGTGLPDTFFHKVLVRKTYHEFSDIQSMTADLYRVLKPEGELIVTEYIKIKSGKVENWRNYKVSTCNKMPIKEIIEVIEKNGFIYSRELLIPLQREDKNIYQVSMAFRKKE